MPFDSNGNFTRTQNWTSDFENGIEIVCDRHDDEDDNFANGFNECMLRDGRAPATGNLKMGNFRITGLADGQTSNDAINKGQLDAQNSRLSALITSSISTTLATLYPIGSIYIGTQETCPLTTIISGSSWTLVATKVVIDVDSAVAVKGTGKTLGLTNGSINVGLSNPGNDTNANGRLFDTSSYDVNVSTSASLATNQNGKWGVVTDATKSGLTGVATSTTLTVNVWKRTA